MAHFTASAELQSFQSSPTSKSMWLTANTGRNKNSTTLLLVDDASGLVNVANCLKVGLHNI